MRAAAIRLLDERHQVRVKAFERNISSLLYRQICSEAPGLKEQLLESTRKYIFNQKAYPSDTAYRASAEIFKADSPDDLIKLFDTLPEYRNTEETKKIIFDAFAKSDSPEIRQKALDLIAQGLQKAKHRIREEVDQAFPYYDEAEDWLSEMIDEGKFTVKSLGTWSSDPAIQKAISRRDNILEKFVEKAKGQDYDDEWRDPTDGYDSDDSDYKERLDEAVPDLQKALLYWLEMLGNWENREEAEKIWNQVKEETTEGFGLRTDDLFVVDELATSLADVWVPFSASDG